MGRGEVTEAVPADVAAGATCETQVSRCSARRAALVLSAGGRGQDSTGVDIPGKPGGAPLHFWLAPQLLPIHAPVELEIVKVGEASLLFPAKTSLSSAEREISATHLLHPGSSGKSHD